MWLGEDAEKEKTSYMNMLKEGEKDELLFKEVDSYNFWGVKSGKEFKLKEIRIKK